MNENKKETVDVQVETIDIETKETKKEKAVRIAKTVGGKLLGVAKITTCAVGTVVLGAIAVGFACGKSDNTDDSVSNADDVNTDDNDIELVETTEEFDM